MLEKMVDGEKKTDAKRRTELYVFSMQKISDKNTAMQRTLNAYRKEHGLETSEDAAWEIRRTERGKPYFPNLQDVFLSVTDSRELRIIALGGQPVGIDLQCMEVKGGRGRNRQEQCLVLAERWFHPEEFLWTAGTSSELPEEANWFLPRGFSPETVEERFFCIWTGKEAYVKYTGTGIDEDFSHFSILDPALPVTFTFHKLKFPGDFQKKESKWMLCVCTREPAELVFHNPAEIL